MRVKQALIDKLTGEVATLKRHKFAAGARLTPAGGSSWFSRRSGLISKPS
jgi:hypothetical protein